MVALSTLHSVCREWSIGGRREYGVVVMEAGLVPHIKCFAHTLNLETQAGLSEPHLSYLLERASRIKAFLHQSSAAFCCAHIKNRN